MTPKQKAKQLVKKFTSATMTLVADYEWVDDIQSAKQCALIAVDEIIEAIEWHEYETPNKEIRFWVEVKKEIELL
jgi:hypothetical protein